MKNKSSTRGGTPAAPTQKVNAKRNLRLVLMEFLKKKGGQREPLLVQKDYFSPKREIVQFPTPPHLKSPEPSLGGTQLLRNAPSKRAMKLTPIPRLSGGSLTPL